MCKSTFLNLENSRQILTKKPLTVRHYFASTPTPHSAVKRLSFIQKHSDTTVCYYHVMYEFEFKEFLDIQATIECSCTMKLVRDMIIAYIQMHRTNTYSQHSPIIWPVWLNGWVLVHELNSCGFESCCFHLNSCNTTWSSP